MTPPTAADGRALGKTALATRTRLLAALDEAMHHNPWKRLTAQSVAQEAECSLATFYQYFRELEEAVLALAEQQGTHADNYVRRVMVLLAAEGYPDARRVLAAMTADLEKDATT